MTLRHTEINCILETAHRSAALNSEETAKDLAKDLCPDVVSDWFSKANAAIGESRQLFPNLDSILGPAKGKLERQRQLQQQITDLQRQLAAITAA